MSALLFKNKKLILFFGDIICLYAGLYITLIIRYRYLASVHLADHLIPFSLIYLIWLIIFYIADLYEPKKNDFNDLRLLANLIQVVAIGGIIAVLIFYFLAPIMPAIKPQRVLLINLMTCIALLFFWRRYFYNLLKSTRVFNRVLVIGDNPLILELAEEIRNHPQLGYQLLIENNPPDDLSNYCQNEKINTIITANGIQDNQETVRKIFQCLPLGLDIRHINGFYEEIALKIPVSNINLEWFLENLSENSKKSYEATKRISDILLSVFGLIVSLPFLPFIALIIKLESPGPIIFKQIRVGKSGRHFLAMKFRSMVSDAEKNGAQWAVKNDPRITRFGKIMRKTRLDEIPQLINILRGEMSLIGPRPERPEFTKMLTEEIPFYHERLLVKPGLTGWAQLLGPAYGGSKEETVEKLKYDLYYIKNRNLTLDLSIILKTIRIVLSKKGQ
jgi:exopolysaccharide biosynthesis polyprenyl glycosylphosphotransferase